MTSIDALLKSSLTTVDNEREKRNKDEFLDKPDDLATANLIMTKFETADYNATKEKANSINEDTLKKSVFIEDFNKDATGTPEEKKNKLIYGALLCERLKAKLKEQAYKAVSKEELKPASLFSIIFRPGSKGGSISDLKEIGTAIKSASGSSSGDRNSKAEKIYEAKLKKFKGRNFVDMEEEEKKMILQILGAIKMPKEKKNDTLVEFLKNKPVIKEKLTSLLPRGAIDKGTEDVFAIIKWLEENNNLLKEDKTAVDENYCELLGVGNLQLDVDAAQKQYEAEKESYQKTEDNYKKVAKVKDEIKSIKTNLSGVMTMMDQIYEQERKEKKVELEIQSMEGEDGEIKMKENQKISEVASIKEQLKQETDSKTKIENSTFDKWRQATSQRLEGINRIIAELNEKKTRREGEIDREILALKKRKKEFESESEHIKELLGDYEKEKKERIKKIITVASKDITEIGKELRVILDASEVLKNNFRELREEILKELKFIRDSLGKKQFLSDLDAINKAVKKHLDEFDAKAKLSTTSIKDLKDNLEKLKGNILEEIKKIKDSLGDTDIGRKSRIDKINEAIEKINATLWTTPTGALAGNLDKLREKRDNILTKLNKKDAKNKNNFQKWELMVISEQMNEEITDFDREPFLNSKYPDLSAIGEQTKALNFTDLTSSYTSAHTKFETAKNTLKDKEGAFKKRSTVLETKIKTPRDLLLDLIKITLRKKHTALGITELEIMAQMKMTELMEGAVPEYEKKINDSLLAKVIGKELPLLSLGKKTWKQLWEEFMPTRELLKNAQYLPLYSSEEDIQKQVDSGTLSMEGLQALATEVIDPLLDGKTIGKNLSLIDGQNLSQLRINIEKAIQRNTLKGPLKKIDEIISSETESEVISTKIGEVQNMMKTTRAKLLETAKIGIKTEVAVVPQTSPTSSAAGGHGSTPEHRPRERGLMQRISEAAAGDFLENIIRRGYSAIKRIFGGESSHH